MTFFISLTLCYSSSSFSITVVSLAKKDTLKIVVSHSLVNRSVLSLCIRPAERIYIHLNPTFFVCVADQLVSGLLTRFHDALVEDME